MNKSIRLTNLYALLILVIFLIGSMILNPIFLYLGFNDLLRTFTTYTLLLFIPTLIFIKQSGSNNIKEILRIKPINIKSIFLVILFAITIQPFMNFISGLSNLFFTNTLNDYLIEVMSLPSLFLVLTLAVLPAIFEEIPTRGMILSGYEHVDVKIAALINGLFFGMLHLNFQQFFYAFLLGFLFVYLVKATGSIFSSMIAHFVINATQVLTLKLAFANFGSEYVDMMNNVTTDEMMLSVMAALFLAVIFTPVAIVFLYLLIKVNKKEELFNFRFDKESLQILKSKHMIPFYITVVIFILVSVLIELLASLPV
ncbi:CPBP family intramembrane glutamic endopeptidase [Vallitalea okinawensis]|uniref:CPBP family intramembrane glutamic endopeptidase n=1 Tax=Vallitalea okinawensis TaxID=2078660 RepID=UPI000CFB3E73|nr:type II CAAX endopeptidase family protein [Vallitalea okinawensis]